MGAKLTNGITLASHCNTLRESSYNVKVCVVEVLELLELLLRVEPLGDGLHHVSNGGVHGGVQPAGRNAYK